jgi:hypothetical protein
MRGEIDSGMPQPETFEAVSFSPSFRELAIDRTIVERGLGYRKGPAPEIVRQLIDEILPEIPNRLAIQCGFRILPTDDISITKKGVLCGDTRLSTGPVIAKQLRKSKTTALFVSTAGPHLEQWSHQLMAEGDMMKGYLVDTVGSEVADRASEWLEKQIEERVAPFGWKMTNRYSPGYCDWPVSDQQNLFSFLPPRFCGISLSASSLMSPIKSLSGIIGLGPEVHRGAYQCSICDLTDCFRRIDESELAAEHR